MDSFGASKKRKAYDFQWDAEEFGEHVEEATVFKKKKTHLNEEKENDNQQHARRRRRRKQKSAAVVSISEDKENVVPSVPVVPVASTALQNRSNSVPEIKSALTQVRSSSSNMKHVTFSSPSSTPRLVEWTTFLSVSKERDALTEEKNYLEAQLSTTRVDFADKEKLWQDEKSNFQNEATTLRQAVNTLEENQKLYEIELARHKTKAEQLASEKRGMETKIALLQQNLDVEKANRNKVASAKEKKLESELQEAKKTIAELRSRLETLEKSKVEEEPEEASDESDDEDAVEVYDDEKPEVADAGTSPAFAAFPIHTRFASTPNKPSRVLEQVVEKTPVSKSLSSDLLTTPGGRPFVEVPPVNPAVAVNVAPIVYGEPKNKAKKSEYAVALEEQMKAAKEKRKAQHLEEYATQNEYYPFGKPGGGAPVRDANANVVANVTFTRSKRFLPIDHPDTPLATGSLFPRCQVRQRSGTA